MRFTFIAKHRGIRAVAWLCEALDVSRSGFPAWLSHPPLKDKDFSTFLGQNPPLELRSRLGRLRNDASERSVQSFHSIG